MPQVLQSARLRRTEYLLAENLEPHLIGRQNKVFQLIFEMGSSLARALQSDSLAVVAGVGPQLQTSANPKTL